MMPRLLFVLLLCGVNAAHAEDWLLTPEEASTYRLSAEDAARFDTDMTRRDNGSGPSIQFLLPRPQPGPGGQAQLHTAEDFALSMLFEKATPNSAPVDMRSFRALVYASGDFKPITERFQAYLQAAQNRVEAKHLHLDQGRYALLFRIKDTDGDMTEKSVLWVVE